jgi:ComF family protein
MGDSWPGRLSKAITGLFVPATCPSCGGGLARGRVGQICAACSERIDRVVEPWCALCGVPVGDDAAVRASGCARTCGPRSFDAARAYGLQTGLLRDLVTRLKYGQEQALGEPLGLLMLAAVQEHFVIQEYEAVVPVPLHPNRQRERGFNQAFVLARPIAREGRIPIVRALQRNVATAPQVGQTGDARSSNVHGVFSLSPRTKEKVGKRNVLLVDDVMTTGSTAHEAARTLKRAGAARVDVITLARAP